MHLYLVHHFNYSNHYATPTTHQNKTLSTTALSLPSILLPSTVNTLTKSSPSSPPSCIISKTSGVPPITPADAPTSILHALPPNAELIRFCGVCPITIRCTTPSLPPHGPQRLVQHTTGVLILWLGIIGLTVLPHPYGTGGSDPPRQSGMDFDANRARCWAEAMTCSTV
eukprot:CCRYP_018822-RB/>CCRYP_018822-RB protein AED:0.42 eAED:1.00 QI:0/0/0/1/0/0/2/0/168